MTEEQYLELLSIRAMATKLGVSLSMDWQLQEATRVLQN